MLCDEVNNKYFQQFPSYGIIFTRQVMRTLDNHTWIRTACDIKMDLVREAEEMVIADG